MTMKNKDIQNEKRKELLNKVKEAGASGDPEQFLAAIENYTKDVQNSIIEEAKAEVGRAIDAMDNNVLAARGTRVLTSKEKEFYNKTIEALKSADPKAALSNLDVVMPETVIDSVFEDLIGKHELLSVIDFQNTTGLTKMILNKSGKQLATWGKLCTEIVKELEGGFETVDMVLNKLTAWIPVCNDMLDLGPAWLDRYVRTILYEAVAYGLEDGIINGDGDDKPIGMIMDVSRDKIVQGGKHTPKEKVKVTSLDPAEYGALVGKMTTNEAGNLRIVKDIILIVNPRDYCGKIFPATTIRRADGTYANDILPLPTKVIQSTEIEEGTAILGMANRYFMGIGLNNRAGKIEYSDDFKFLEDQRTYKIKLYGNGLPKDNNDFIVLDISDLKPAVQTVKVISDTPVGE